MHQRPDLTLPLRQNQKNEFKILTLHYTQDPRKQDPAWVDQAKRLMANEPKWQREMEIDWSAAGGELVFPYFLQWSNKIVVEPFEITPEMGGFFCAGLDYGVRNPTMFEVIWCDPKGHPWLVWEYGSPGHYLDHVPAIKGCPYFAQVNGSIWSDPWDPSFNAATQQVAGGFKSIRDLLRESGVDTRPAPRVERLTRAQKIGALWGAGNLADSEPQFKIFRSCAHAIHSFRHLRYEEWTGASAAKHGKHEGILKRDDHAFDSCVAEGTRVATSRGAERVEAVREGDLVWTRWGLRRVLRSSRTGRDRKVHEVLTLDGRRLRATGNHPIWTENRGWVRLDTLSYGDILLCPFRRTTDESRRFDSRGFCFGDTPIPNGRGTETTLSLGSRTGKRESSHFIGKSGSAFVGRFRRDITFITRTGTREITRLGISNACPQESMFVSTLQMNAGNRCATTLCESGRSQRHGIGASKVGSGTGRTQSGRGRCDGRIPRQPVARSADEPIRTSFGKESVPCVPLVAGRRERGRREGTSWTEGVRSVERSIGRTAIKRPLLVRALVDNVTLVGREDVYNLEVEEIPEYFADGILVHNCSFAMAANAFFEEGSHGPEPGTFAHYMAERKKEKRREEASAFFAFPP